jgi:hypothetical protein
MNKEIETEFKEKFATIEEALKYIADSQAKSEFIHKRDIIEARKRQTEYEKRQSEYEKRQAEYEKRQEAFRAEFEKGQKLLQKQFNHLAKLTGIAFEELEFQEEKLETAGKALQKKRKSK